MLLFSLRLTLPFRKHCYRVRAVVFASVHYSDTTHASSHNMCLRASLAPTASATGACTAHPRLKIEAPGQPPSARNRVQKADFLKAWRFTNNLLELLVVFFEV